MASDTDDIQERDSVNPTEAQAQQAPPKPAPAADQVTFKDFTLHTNQILKEYCKPPVMAYAAQKGPGRDLSYIAYVCERNLVPRIKAAEKYAKFMNPCVLPLETHGVVYWPAAKAQRYVFIYKNTLGACLAQEDKNAALGLKQDQVLQAVVKPIINLLLDFQDKDFVHGAIRPSNMYANIKNGVIDKVVLGDCLSLPNSYGQHVLFEPIERSDADPIARGYGTMSEDIYAFGVTLALLLRTSSTHKDMNDKDIIKSKMEQGSYAAITGRDRFKGSILELLRGTLHDDPSQRWTLEEIESWLSGVRLSPKQAIRQKRASRPLNFLNNKYLLAPLLALDIDVNAEETVDLVESGDLIQWLDRSVEDSEITEKVEETLAREKDRGSLSKNEERLAANLSIALDPFAPIRYRSRRMMGDGIGKALARDIIEKNDLRLYAELFLDEIAMNWITVQTRPNVDVGLYIGRFDRCRSYLRSNKIGFGIERCLYLLCPEAYCLSEKLADYIVTSPEDLLDAFEDMCEKGKVPHLFIDRHSAAFLAIKDPKCIDSYLFDLDRPDEYRRVLGNLKTLATIQKRADTGSYPALAQALNKKLGCVYERYHDREIREKLKDSIERHAKRGDLVKMAGILDNEEINKKDAKAFAGAMLEYRSYESELVRLNQGLENKARFGQSAGAEVAAIASCVIAGIVILFVAFMFFSGNSTF